MHKGITFNSTPDPQVIWYNRDMKITKSCLYCGKPSRAKRKLGEWYYCSPECKSKDAPRRRNIKLNRKKPGVNLVFFYLTIYFPEAAAMPFAANTPLITKMTTAAANSIPPTTTLVGIVAPPIPIRMADIPMSEVDCIS